MSKPKRDPLTVSGQWCRNCEWVESDNPRPYVQLAPNGLMHTYRKASRTSCGMKVKS